MPVMNKLLCFLLRLIPRRAAAWGSVTVLGLPAGPGASTPDATDNNP